MLDVITSDKRADFVRVNRENLVQLKQLAGLRVSQSCFTSLILEWWNKFDRDTATDFSLSLSLSLFLFQSIYLSPPLISHSFKDIVVLDQILTSPKTASKHTTKSMYVLCMANWFCRKRYFFLELARRSDHMPSAYRSSEHLLQ